MMVNQRTTYLFGAFRHGMIATNATRQISANPCTGESWPTFTRMPGMQGSTNQGEAWLLGVPLRQLLRDECKAYH